MKVKSTSNIRETITALKRVSQSHQEARAAAGGAHSFGVDNTARDLAARNRRHRIRYFWAVNDGRARIVAGANLTNNFERLHFKVGPNRWRVVSEVGPAAPARITDRAADRLRESIPVAVRAALPKGMLPTGEDFRQAVEAMKRQVISDWRQATIESTEKRGTKQAYYNTPAPPLADSFVIVDGKGKGRDG